MVQKMRPSKHRRLDGPFFGNRVTAGQQQQQLVLLLLLLLILLLFYIRLTPDSRAPAQHRAKVGR